MDSVNKTLYIPLYGKAYVSRKGLFLHDPKAEEIWAAEGFPLKGKSKSKWLAYHMGMRSAVFDRWVQDRLRQFPEAAVLHIGCGMDSRHLRLGTGGPWYDVDFPEVTRERRKYYEETATYHMIGSDIREDGWLEALPQYRQVIVVMEGVSMYLAPDALKAFLAALCGRFSGVSLLTDCYTRFGAKASKYKNPINDVGVTLVYGIDNAGELEEGTGLSFVAEHALTPAELIEALSGTEKIIFRSLFAGSFAKKIYRLYEYRSGEV